MHIKVHVQGGHHEKIDPGLCLNAIRFLRKQHLRRKNREESQKRLGRKERNL